MLYLKNYQGVKIRFTDERRAHILEHPEMVAMEETIVETLLNPEYVVQSKSDKNAQLYYKYYSKTLVGGKLLCVVVKQNETDSFVLTAYLTDKIKKGEILWNGKK